MAAVNIDKQNKHGIVPFKGENYPDWSFRMKFLFEQEKLWNIVNTATDEDKRNAAGWLDNDIKARRILVDCVDNECLEYVKSKDTSHEMWISLGEVYSATSLTKRVSAFKQLTSLKCGINEDLQSFFHKFDVIARSYKEAGGTLADIEFIVMLLSCLSEDYEVVVTALSTMSENEFTSTKVRKCLLEEEMRQNQSSIRCFNCNQEGHN